MKAINVARKIRVDLVDAGGLGTTREVSEMDHAARDILIHEILSATCEQMSGPEEVYGTEGEVAWFACKVNGEWFDVTVAKTMRFNITPGGDRRPDAGRRVG